MKHRSPLVTLAGLVVAFAVMFAGNYAGASRQAAAPGAAATSEDPSAAPSPSAASPSGSPTADQTSTPSASETAAPSASQTAARRAFPNEVVYAGRTSDGSAAVAVAVLGDRAAAYFCDGRNVESWLRGTVSGVTITLTGKNGASLTARLNNDTVQGGVVIHGETSVFALKPAKKPAGLYRAKGTKATIGWIVLPDGQQVGIQTSDGASAPAPPLDPEQPTVRVDGETLDAEPLAGDETF